jgi:ketosteroid isomerase-like protein
MRPSRATSLCFRCGQRPSQAHSYCTACNRVLVREWREANRERDLENDRRWYADPTVQLPAAHARMARANPARLRG